MLCPKEVAGITTSENNIQLRFAVDDIEKVLKLGVQNSGTILQDVQQQGEIKYAALSDPDGSSIELRQGLKSKV